MSVFNVSVADLTLGHVMMIIFATLVAHVLVDAITNKIWPLATKKPEPEAKTKEIPAHPPTQGV
jgi:hypothetical protein